MDAHRSPVVGYLDNAGRIYELAAQGYFILLLLLCFFLTVVVIGYLRNR